MTRFAVLGRCATCESGPYSATRSTPAQQKGRPSAALCCRSLPGLYRHTVGTVGVCDLYVGWRGGQRLAAGPVRNIIGHELVHDLLPGLQQLEFSGFWTGLEEDRVSTGWVITGGKEIKNRRTTAVERAGKGFVFNGRSVAGWGAGIGCVAIDFDSFISSERF